MEYLTPHTPEWFSAFEADNPAQAASTKQIVALAQRIDVCSDCGSQPAEDYKIEGAQFSANVGATIRLCEDCRGIRNNAYGESFTCLGLEGDRD
jgi:hypothetical protein